MGVELLLFGVAFTGMWVKFFASSTLSLSLSLSTCSHGFLDNLDVYGG